jgi:hypothetical protein
MRYLAVMTASWERRPHAEFTGVASRRHAPGLWHPAGPARAIFSPYLLEARFDAIETRCGGATVYMTVATGFKPAFAIPRQVTLELVLEGGHLKVDEVTGW